MGLPRPFRSYNVHFTRGMSGMAPEEGRGNEGKVKGSEKGRGARERGMHNDGKEDERVSGVAQDSGDIVQIAESGDIDHRGAAAAEPSGTDTSDPTVPLLPPLQPFLPFLAVILSFSLYFSLRKAWRLLFSPGCHILKIYLLKSLYF